MYTNSSCTLYLSSLGFSKLYISKAFLTQRSVFSQQKAGLSYVESAFCMFIGDAYFHVPYYYSPYSKLLCGDISIGEVPKNAGKAVKVINLEAIPFTGGKDFLIEGDADIDVDVSDEKAKSETIQRLKKAGAKTIKSAEYKKMGSHNMRHWELSCN